MKQELQDVREGCLPGRGRLERGYHYLPQDMWEDEDEDGVKD